MLSILAPVHTNHTQTDNLYTWWQWGPSCLHIFFTPRLTSSQSNSVEGNFSTFPKDSILTSIIHSGFKVVRKKYYKAVSVKAKCVKRGGGWMGKTAGFWDQAILMTLNKFLISCPDQHTDIITGLLLGIFIISDKSRVWHLNSLLSNGSSSHMVFNKKQPRMQELEWWLWRQIVNLKPESPTECDFRQLSSPLWASVFLWKVHQCKSCISAMAEANRSTWDGTLEKCNLMLIHIPLGSQASLPQWCKMPAGKWLVLTSMQPGFVGSSLIDWGMTSLSISLGLCNEECALF